MSLARLSALATRRKPLWSQHRLPRPGLCCCLVDILQRRPAQAGASFLWENGARPPTRAVRDPQGHRLHKAHGKPWRWAALGFPKRPFRGGTVSSIATGSNAPLDLGRHHTGAARSRGSPRARPRGPPSPATGRAAPAPTASPRLSRPSPGPGGPPTGATWPTSPCPSRSPWTSGWPRQTKAQRWASWLPAASSSSHSCSWASGESPVPRPTRSEGRLSRDLSSPPGDFSSSPPIRAPRRGPKPRGAPSEGIRHSPDGPSGAFPWLGLHQGPPTGEAGPDSTVRFGWTPGQPPRFLRGGVGLLPSTRQTLFSGEGGTAAASLQPSGSIQPLLGPSPRLAGPLRPSGRCHPHPGSRLPQRAGPTMPLARRGCHSHTRLRRSSDLQAPPPLRVAREKGTSRLRRATCQWCPPSLAPQFGAVPDEGGPERSQRVTRETWGDVGEGWCLLSPPRALVSIKMAALSPVSAAACPA
ncbi:translation initiation factor IF-2-like [Gracilinanus agilis]|uniref:translation initiation factor IF-2-like n=1 Tax=Gracilinanus agilis TaxID=191870 RepID=UPI001CFE22F3|nr:translation initiation factor IF-2-like [Gracilinanus agilis]